MIEIKFTPRSFFRIKRNCAQCVQRENVAIADSVLLDELMMITDKVHLFTTLHDNHHRHYVAQHRKRTYIICK